MKTSDVKNNDYGRLDIFRDNAAKDSKEARKQNLPRNEKMGKNKEGYDILPNEGK